MICCIRLSKLMICIPLINDWCSNYPGAGSCPYMYLLGEELSPAVPGNRNQGAIHGRFVNQLWLRLRSRFLGQDAEAEELNHAESLNKDEGQKIGKKNRNKEVVIFFVQAGLTQ